MSDFYSSAPIERIAALKGQGAPWYRLAEAYYAGEDEVDREATERSGKRDNGALVEYRRKACLAATIPAPLMHEMGLALARLEVVAGTKAAAAELVSADFPATLAALRVAFRFPAEAKQALRDLKAGLIAPEDIEAMPGAQPESEDWKASLDKLAELKGQGAPWWRMVAPFLAGDESSQVQTLGKFRSVGESASAEFRRRLVEICGVGAEGLTTMSRILMRVQALGAAAGVPALSLLSDDFEAVELAVKLAASDREAGIAALLDLAAGRTDKDEIERRVLTGNSMPSGPGGK
jgi:hypothetical protein